MGLFLSFCTLDTCRSIGAMVSAQELLVERFGGINMINIDHNMARRVPRVNPLRRHR